MRFCQKHWDMLREEVERQGMGELISPDGENLAERMVREITTGEDTKESFDPLFRCMSMMMGRALEMAGLSAMSPEFGCPICEFNSQRTPEGSCPCPNPDCPGKEPGSVPDFEEWITGEESCVAAVKEMVVANGWI